MSNPFTFVVAAQCCFSQCAFLACCFCVTLLKELYYCTFGIGLINFGNPSGFQGYCVDNTSSSLVARRAADN
jgi:hypothetical protein